MSSIAREVQNCFTPKPESFSPTPLAFWAPFQQILDPPMRQSVSTKYTCIHSINNFSSTQFNVNVIACCALSIRVFAFIGFYRGFVTLRGFRALAKRARASGRGTWNMFIQGVWRTLKVVGLGLCLDSPWRGCYGGSRWFVGFTCVKALYKGRYRRCLHALLSKFPF